VGGVLFFGKHPEKMFFQAVTRCLRFKGKDKVHIIDDKIYGGTVYQQYKQAMEWLKDKMQVAYIMEGIGPRKEVWEIPLEVFKEAIINALSHRDYYEKGATIMIEVYDDRVEISNPGGLLPAVAKSFGTKSMSRNPLIFGLFTRMNLVEQVGSGVFRMRNLMLEAKLPEPEYNMDGFFTIKFFRKEKGGDGDEATKKDLENNTGKSDETVEKTIAMSEKMSERMSEKMSEKILDIIRVAPHVTIDKLSASLNTTTRTIERNLKYLKAKNLIERIGPDKGGYWKVLK